MCGIHGVIALRPGVALDALWAGRMGMTTRHRGPDDAGLYQTEGLLLGMRRLSIIDVAGGHQPLGSADGKIQVVCNGEIYNFRQLRMELEKSGYRFATGSDCEVLVHLYAAHGEAMVARLDGMFGFALWDGRRRRLVLGRDRLGIKPLYYWQDGEKLAFASEIKALLEVPGVRADIDPASLDELLYLGYVAAPHTLFRGVRKLPPGHLLAVEEGRIHVRPFWRMPRHASATLTEGEAREELRTVLRESVAAQMVADVPLGAFLSGGVDSSAVVAMMAATGAGQPKTYAIGFDLGSAGAYYNELPDARRVASHFGTDHHEIVVRPDVVTLLPALLWHMDEPVADSAIITTYLVAQFARQSVTVILSGVGGDELLGGYRRYLGPHYLRRLNHVPRWLREGCLVPLARRLPSDRHGPVSNLLRYAREFITHSALPPDEQYIAYVRLFEAAARARLLRTSPAGNARDPLKAAFARASGEDFINRLMQVDLETQLPDDLLLLTDKMTMAASLECRVPLLSNGMLDLGLRLPSSLKIGGHRLKHLFRSALADVLPPATLQKSKRGFGAPMGAWIKKELRPLLRIALSPEAVRRRGLLEPAAVQEIMSAHESARQDYSDHLQCLLNLELWCRLYLDGRSPDDVGQELAEHVKGRVAA
jgi:asparagine synthase (glutamine-hydrolysing)